MTETAPITAEVGDRIVVKPAHAGGRIPDPAHRNFLAQEGTEVVWDHSWIGRWKRGEIVEVKLAPAAGSAEPADTETASDTPAVETPAEAHV